MSSNIKRLTREMYYKELGKAMGEVKYKKFPPIPGFAGYDGEFYYYAVGDKNKLFVADPITEQILVPLIYQDIDRVYGQIKSEAAKLESSVDDGGDVSLKLPAWNWTVEKISDETTYTMNEFKRLCRMYDDYDGCQCSPGTYLLKETSGLGYSVRIEVKQFQSPYGGDDMYAYLCFEDAITGRLSMGEVGRLFEFYKNIIFENGKKYYKAPNFRSEFDANPI